MLVLIGVEKREGKSVADIPVKAIETTYEFEVEKFMFSCSALASSILGTT